MELEPKFGQIILKTKPTYYNTATPELDPKFGQIIHKAKPTYYITVIPHSSRARAKVWSNFTTSIAYKLLQQSFPEFTIMRTYIMSYYIP